MEVIFSYVASRQAVVGVCSRTNFLFQRLDLASETSVVSMTSNSSTGMLVVTHEDGILQTYMPVETDSDPVAVAVDGPQMQTQMQTQTQQRPKSVFGRYRWIDSVTIDAAKVFYYQSGGERIKFCDRRQRKPGDIVDVSVSYDGTLLVAHRQQLAVFKTLLPNDAQTVVSEKTTTKAKTKDAPLLWTTVVPSPVVTAKISGDGRALVVVIDQPDKNGTFGAMTFLHDKDDGSSDPTGNGSAASMGMVFKPGPFLKHAKPISRISFRGLGHVTPSANPEENQGNDLLLTYCKGDSATRIFNQNSWRQLMLWTAPPNSRADWIRGSSAFSLGDLESCKKPANSRGARTGKSNPNSISSDLSYATGPISSGLPPIGGFRSGGAGSPTSDAGAWIAEVTFRGAYPALRLSRLSYMKRGNDGSQPAHFESIAAMLPAGSIIAESVLDADDMGLSIQGVWPAWNPWLSEPSSNNEADDSLSGSAMAFLGLSSVHPPGTNQGTFGEYYAGGTHSPPTELRLVSSHPENGHLVTMDFPLWGEDDFGAMELGSPIRSVLALSAVPSLRTEQREMPLIAASMDYESSRLCAETESEGRSISLFWRKEGCMSTYSTQWRDEDAVFARQCTDAVAPASPDLLHDVSLVPVPLALPPLKLPKGTASSNEDNVVAIRWWPDDSFGGPPLLVAVTSSKTILVYEIPPPMFALEPAMPNFDSTNPQSSISTGAASVYDNTIAEDGSDDEDSKGMQEYEVLVTPHPDFGLGLRLESPMDGLPAIAGSFKKNPLNDGILPAEKTGMINLGDELLSVNGVNLENKTFDDIIATVRHVGAELGPGKPLNMKFRPVPFDRSRKNSAVVHESFSVRSNDHSYCSAGNGKNSNGNTRDSNFDDTGSLAALLFNRSETQQEFGRVIGVLRKGVSSADGEDFEDRFVLLPWSSKAATYSSRKVRAAALMIQGCGSKLEVMRVELPSRAGLDKVQKFDLGLIDIEENNTNNANGEPVSIRSITCAESSAERWSFIVSDSLGNLRLVYLRFTEKTSYTGEGSSFEMSHKHHRIVDTGADFRDFRVLASSSNTVAWTQKSESPRRTIRVWHSRPDASSRDLQRDGAIKDEHFNKDYYESTIVVDPSESKSELRDVCFLTTGYLEANSSGKLSENVPMDAYPHLLRLIRATLHSYDEKNYILSDWHPETLFTHMCTAEKGPKSALKGDIKRILLWISDKINGSPDDNLSSSVPLLVAPLASWGGEVLTGVNDTEDEESTNVESGARLLASMQIGTSRVSTDLDKDEQQLKQLYDVLKTYVSDLSKRNGTSGKNTRSPTVSNESSQETDSIPGFLTTMNESELLVLRAILKVVIDPPKYGVLDLQGQLTLTIHSLHREIQNEADTKGQREKRTSNFSMGGVYVKRQLSSETSKSKLPPQNASAGCLAALLSDYQGLMINTIRKPGQKLSWSEARNLRLPFWLRSDEKLRQLSEEIGQQMYRESKDILKASMFFIIAGKKRTLANLAAADPTNSGRKLQKFLTDHDFSSQRGRLAAEKNAFSLLRKNQYDAASAFFLLAEPPILKSAVETIATKMEDLDLAFLVARLMGNSQPSLALGMGRGFAGIMGGGGGFAGSITTKSEATKDKEKFEDWKHKLGGVAKSLILDRILPSVHDDTCLSAVQHLWLGHSDEASNWLTGLIDGDGENAPRFATDISVPQLHNLMDSARKNRYSTILTVNSFINLASGPFLLKMMKANKRTRLASTFALSRSLVNAGIEIPAIRSLLKDMKEADFQEDQELHLTAAPKQHLSAPASGAMSSSIFDSFDGPPKPKVSAPASGAMSSSIFDSFDGPPKPKVSAPASGAMSSSIFDSFDGPPKPKVSAPASGAMSSSIFDSFDGPPKPKVSAPASGAMASSIFDSFDGPPKSKVSAPASGAMASSIFDSFDGPPKSKVSAPASGAMPSSIFDAYDSRPHTKGAPTPADSKHEEKIPYSSDSSFCETGELRSPPSIWIQWRESLIMDAAARRLVRELSTLCAPYFCDKFEGPGFCEHPLMTSESSQILQFHCDGEELMKEVCDVVEHVSKVSQLESTAIVERAIQLLHSPYQFYRTLHVILLLLAIRQVELAEDVLRTASKSLIDMCYSNALSNDHVTKGRHCAAHFSSLSSQKFAAHISWQLELCLWIHRGGALPLSGIALKEAICSVRIGYFVASRNREYETQEMLIRHPPDCLVNEKAGRQLWSSLKIISGGGRRENKVIGTGSGGWEFLVDCRRSRATELLREKPTGSFIIRPHPQDHGVFTISFKTNLIPSEESNGTNTTNSGTPGVGNASRPESRPIKRDDVVQHAIIRLSDSGFRCGSFGPFGTLMDLLEAVSSSLPFDLRFDLPPIEGIIKEEGSKPSPNSAFLRKLGMQKASYFSKKPDDVFSVCDYTEESDDPEESKQNSTIEDKQKTEMFGLFFELLLLHELRKQLSAVAVAEYDSAEWIDDTLDDIDSIGSISDASVEIGVEEEYATASRIMRPLLTWCRILEIEVGSLFAPSSHRTQLPKTSDESVKEETDSEILTSAKSNKADTGDFILRRMMKPDSGVEFQTLRLGDGGENAMVMLFCKKEAVAWILNTGIEMNEEDALNKLNLMEETRVIERVDLGLLAPKAYKKSNKADENENAATGTCSVSSDVRYRLVDPWEVEPLENREAETKGASLGRECLLAFNLPRVASCCEGQLQSIGGLPLLELWTALKGNLSLTKSLATVHPPWERSAGGDLLLRDGINTEPSIYENSIRVHLYRNSLFETMKVPQRFVALIQVELLDLKNLTSPGGSLSLTVYSLLRLKRARSSSPLTSKARTLDSVSTDPIKLAKTSGPNAPASWGSLVRFRFPLPENTDIEGKCNDRDCESLFKGPPSVLQVSVYEKKFMSDSYLGGADIKLDGLSSGGQLEEWVPLKTETQGINWFARIRLTLRFELIVGRMRIRQLCSVGGAQFDLKQSVSTPDILSYFESYFETD
eukprot:jgi/Psemu1/246275/estExt_Genewise1.C_7590016